MASKKSQPKRAVKPSPAKKSGSSQKAQSDKKKYTAQRVRDYKGYPDGSSMNDQEKIKNKLMGAKPKKVAGFDPMGIRSKVNQMEYGYKEYRKGKKPGQDE